jgi:phosphomannomutase
LADDDRAMAGLLARARAWIEGDPDPATRGELRGLIDAGNLEELVDRMAGNLVFGTAGMRGRVEAGSNRMNRAVVIRATRGLADVLLATCGGVPQAPVVVGFDARSSSRTFTADTIGVLAGAGIPVRYFPDPVPTPIVAFTARLLAAPAAVVVTASHNPASDNGYKVYGNDAAQIIPPLDREIAEAIHRVGPAAAVPRAKGAMGGGSPLATPAPSDILDRYWDEIASVRVGSDADRSLRIVYTPLHGVGWAVVEEVLRRGGFEGVHPVPSQRDPHGRFPTAPFPNPEERGALDPALALAAELDADLVLANDPDVDRLAVAIPTEGGWRRLTGDQIGVLLADHLLRHWSGPERPIVINTVVSSPMLRSLAEGYGARFEQTLTGFKWIAHAALGLEAAAAGRFCFGYEEALGYMVGSVVRDKDGISAALAFADLAALLRAEGRGVLDRLDDLYRRHGLWVSSHDTVARPGVVGLAELDSALDRLRSEPPTSLAGMVVSGVQDFREGAETRPLWQPSASLVALQLADRGCVLIRPSGTEPKLKVYVHLRAEAGSHLDSAASVLREAAEGAARELLGSLGLSPDEALGGRG